MRLPGIEPGPAGWKPAILTTRPQTLLKTMGARARVQAAESKKTRIRRFNSASLVNRKGLCLQIFLKMSPDLQINFAENGLRRGSNPGPPAPEAGIIPLDHKAALATWRLAFLVLTVCGMLLRS